MYCIFSAHILNIFPDGSCDGAICRARHNDTNEFNIFQENPYLKSNFIDMITCPYDNCGCSTNNHLPKFLNKDEAIFFVNLCRTKQKNLLENI